MDEKMGSIWLEEYYGNPSVVAVCFSDGEGPEEVIGLTRNGVAATVELLSEWLEYHDARMEEMFSELGNLGGSDD